MSKPYEIELVKSVSSSDYRESMFATLTGLSKAEVLAQWPDELIRRNSWGGQRFVEAARSLNFNVNPRFIKFDPATPWPCVLRLQIPGSWDWGKGTWWALLYNQDTVYQVSPDWGWHELPLKEFKTQYRQCRITSMLQVWMSDTQSFASFSTI